MPHRCQAVLQKIVIKHRIGTGTNISKFFTLSVLFIDSRGL